MTYKLPNLLLIEIDIKQCFADEGNLLIVLISVIDMVVNHPGSISDPFEIILKSH